jgi:YesN/AraC family two-component response regulator
MRLPALLRGTGDAASERVIREAEGGARVPTILVIEDLIISDVVMPGSSGPALFDRLAERHPTCRSSTCPATRTMR